MIHIAIVDDDLTTQSYLQKLLAEAFMKEHLPADFDTYTSGTSFLRSIREHVRFDAVFIDIEMPGLDGIEVCRQLNRIMPEMNILFVSNREDLVYDTFEVTPFRFLPKSRLREMLPGAVHALAVQIARMPGNELVFSDSSGDLYSFSFINIIYIEARNKDCRLVMTTGESLIRCRLSDIAEKLPQGRFIKIHRSYIVHAAYIFLIGKNSVSLTTGEELPLSRGHSAEVRQAFLQYARGSYD